MAHFPCLLLALLLSDASWCEGRDEYIRAGMVAHTCILALERMGLTEGEQEASLGYTVRCYLKTNNTEGKEPIRTQSELQAF